MNVYSNEVKVGDLAVCVQGPQVKEWLSIAEIEMRLEQVKRTREELDRWERALLEGKASLEKAQTPPQT